MHRAYHCWDSPALNRRMELLVFGHAGAPCLVFPTSHGRFYEYEDRGMVAALGHQIAQGHLQLVCVDGVYQESWYNYEADSNLRMWREDQYEHYLLTEVLPLIRHLNPTNYLVATGCSFGASAAVKFAFRHPGVVNRVVGLHGLYDLSRFVTNYTTSVYFHNPVDFLPNLNDEATLAQFRAMDIILVTSQDDPSAWSNDRLSQILWGKNVWHALRVWNGWTHDWPYWRRQIEMYIGGPD